MVGMCVVVVAAAIAIGIPACFIALVQGNASGKAFISIARQPETAGTIRTLLMVSLAFMETLAIYGLLISLMLITKIN